MAGGSDRGQAFEGRGGPRISHLDQLSSEESLADQSPMHLSRWAVFLGGMVFSPQPQMSVLKSQPPVPENVTLLGERVFTEAIKLKWGH